MAMNYFICTKLYLSFFVHDYFLIKPSHFIGMIQKSMLKGLHTIGKNQKMGSKNDGKHLTDRSRRFQLSPQVQVNPPRPRLAVEVNHITLDVRYVF